MLLSYARIEPKASTWTEWSMTRSAGTRGSIFLASFPARSMADLIAARSTTAGTPVKSWRSTRADVVKVENPRGGDNVRLTAPFLDGESSNFIRLNRNKRSLALDLKAPDGKSVFRRLAERADVVVENLRPGTMADLGLDYPRLRDLNPGLVYVAASGWGQSGPYSQLAGLDIMAQGMSGLMSITGEEGRDPVKVGVPICDLVCALYGALAAVSALRARERDGCGQFIDVSL